jgi:hypothetical protein
MGKVGTEGVMQMRTILTTVGTSLLHNAKKSMGVEQLNDQQLSNYLHHIDEIKASAETNSLSRLLQEGDRIDTRQRFNKSLRKLRFPDLRRSQSAQVGEGDCLVFPRGDCDEGIFYFENEQGNIMVCELTRHSDKTYEVLLNKGVKRKKYNGFQSRFVP